MGLKRRYVSEMVTQRLMRQLWEALIMYVGINDDVALRLGVDVYSAQSNAIGSVIGYGAQND